ncbi:MAG: hypothetical protein LBO72_02840 [Helicobacteraceae bacterium]|jgi:hypothetical protein|nr:hypothetical protein [Helicobacteraceae bacterium]
MTLISACSGFAIGFVCWKSCFLLAKPAAAALFDAHSLAPIGAKIAYCVIFAFLCAATALLLLIYPICALVIGGSTPNEFYLGVAASYTGSIFGFLSLLWLRLFVEITQKRGGL